MLSTVRILYIALCSAAVVAVPRGVRNADGIVLLQQQMEALLGDAKMPAVAAEAIDTMGEHSCIQRRVYVASPLEEDWTESVAELQTDDPKFDAGCKKLRGQEAAVEEWMQLWQSRESESSAGASWNPEVFSYHSVINCKGEEVAKVPLEPLVGFLRHPRFLCSVPGYASMVNKNYMLLSWNFEVFPKPKRAYLFDVGASLYKSGPGGASQEWFVESFRKRNVEFTRILCWEAMNFSQSSIYSQMPDDVLDRVSYYNLPASANMSDKFSPMRALDDLVEPDDFVVVKIDIDTPEVELPMIMSILDHPSLCGKIDELFFEHHTSKNPMAKIAWGATASTDMDMKDSYKLFRQLRDCGIRAHSWV